MAIKLVLFFQNLRNLVIRLVKYQQNSEGMVRGLDGRKVGGGAWQRMSSGELGLWNLLNTLLCLFSLIAMNMSTDLGSEIIITEVPAD